MYKVIIPEWEYYFVKSKKTSPKYWLYKDRDKLPLKHQAILRNQPLLINGKAYCCDNEGNRMVKNTKKVGTENIWVLNGNALYSGILHHTMRKKVAGYYHAYFSKYIKEQITKPIDIELSKGELLSISCDIYEIPRGNMPDVSNMWLLEKFFEDALQECGIIEDDGPSIVIESGRKRYHWVKNPEERKLIFNIDITKNETI